MMSARPQLFTAVLFGLFDRDRNAKSSAAQAARFAGKGAAA